MDERGLLDLMIARLDSGHLDGISYREKINLCETFDTEQDFLKAMNGSAMNGPAMNGANRDLDVIRLLAERDEATARLRGINWVSWRSPAYPPLLREIYDPPVVLFFKGSLPNPESPLAAIVGTRKPSPQAVAQAFHIAHDLARSGISVVSGLALGIDTMAHRGNIEGGACTVAVLGSGLDYIYPPSNRTLAQRIMETGGCLLSEYPPGSSPRKWNFPARNRIISGLSRGTLVIEAPQKSGALITAGFALEHNRELWVASSGITFNNGIKTAFDKSGTTKLAEDGAGIIRDASDILEAWNMGGASFAAGNLEEITTGAELAASLAQSLGVAL